MQRQGRRAMVSPCTSSSRQIAHSPASLVRTSSGRQTDTSHHRHESGIIGPFLTKHMFYSTYQNEYFISMSECRYTWHFLTGASKRASAHNVILSYIDSNFNGLTCSRTLSVLHFYLTFIGLKSTDDSVLFVFLSIIIQCIFCRGLLL